MIKYKKIGLFVGHSKLKNGNYTSANGIKNEYLVNKELATEVKKWLDQEGQPNDLIVVPEGKYDSKNYEDDYKLPLANSGKYDLIIEFHCNASNGAGYGAEVLYNSNNGKIVAQRVQDKLKTIFRDRGVKHRDNLYMLTQTKPVAIMLEVFFIDNKDDCKKYDSVGKKELARRIAEGIIDAPIKEKGTEETYYRVIVGSFKDKTNAEKVMKEAKEKGFDGAFLDAYKKVV